MPAYTYMQKTPVGPLTLCEENGAITHLLFGILPPPEGAQNTVTPALQKTINQLEEYFAGSRKQFTVKLAPKGTTFQESVWSALCTIPYGETRSYGQIAKQVGCPKGPRAVGLANNRNPVSIIIPCHRVIGANGKLTGYGGGLDVKETLLKLEGIM